MQLSILEERPHSARCFLIPHHFTWGADGSREKPPEFSVSDLTTKTGTSTMECDSTHKQYTWYQGRRCMACFKYPGIWLVKSTWNWRQSMPFPCWNRTWSHEQEGIRITAVTPFSTSHGYNGVNMVIIQDFHVYLGREWTRLRAHVTILRNVQVEWTVLLR